jgi:hypothetical protein
VLAPPRDRHAPLPATPPPPPHTHTHPTQLYIDSTFYGLRPDGDQFVAQQLRDALEPLLYRYQVRGVSRWRTAWLHISPQQLVWRSV